MRRPRDRRWVGRRRGGARRGAGRGAEEVAPRAVVDASGDAIVAWHAGLATETPAERQLASAVFVLQGVDAGAVGGARSVAVLRALHDAERAGDLPPGCALAAFRASGRLGAVAVDLALGDLRLAHR